MAWLGLRNGTSSPIVQKLLWNGSRNTPLQNTASCGFFLLCVERAMGTAEGHIIRVDDDRPVLGP